MKSLFKTMGLLAALQLTACLETVNSDQVVTEVVHQSYHVAYSESSNTTRVSADYRVGGSMGTSIRLKAPSKVQANGQPMGEDDVLLGAGARYETSFSGFVGDVTTVWTDQEGRPYTNSFEIRPVSLQSAPGHMQTSGTYRIYYTALNVDSEDEIRVMISQQTANSSHFHTSYASNPNLGYVEVDSNDLKNFESGTVTINLERVRSMPLDEVTEEGGYGSARFEASGVSASITNDTGLPPIH